MKEDKLQYCTKHHTNFVTECHSCYREKTECIHGVPFDSECGECIEDKKIVEYGKSRAFTIEEVSCKEKLDSSKHPLKNPDSKHYDMVDGIEAVDRLEQMYSREDLMVWAKISAMKYRLRICNKDDVSKEATKIKTFEAYYKHLEALGDE